MRDQSTEVAIVGGGPAGAALGIQLATRGIEVAIFERWRSPRWRASGVYSSPLTRGRLSALGLTPDQLRALIRPISRMVVEAPATPSVVLDYSDEGGACGIDRVRLERTLLDRAIEVGAQVHEGSTVRDVRIPAGVVDISTADGRASWRARVVVGADGPGGRVAKAAQVDRSVTFLRRTGITGHRADPAALSPPTPMNARMVIGSGWYCGVCPVPDARVNVGLVMASNQVERQLADGTSVRRVLDRTIARLPGDPQPWQQAPATDEVCIATPLAQRVRRRAGAGWLLVGDTAGFIDPLSGEGIHRALVSAELAADAIAKARSGRSDAWDRYDWRMNARFAPKDMFSLLLQSFLGQPWLLSYAMRRLAKRHNLRRTFGRSLADIELGRQLLEPRFLLSLLHP